MNIFATRFVAVSAVALLTACGGGGDAETREAKMEQEAKKHGIDVDVTTVELKSGHGTIGNNLDLPDDFPKDVVLAANWNVISVVPAPTGGYMVQAMTDSDVETVIADVRKNLTAEGWTETAFDQPAAIMTRINFEKGERVATLNVTNTGGPQLSLALVTMKKPG